MAGGGVKVYLTSHLGMRFDVRAYFYQNPMTTLLGATPTNTANSAWVVKAKTGTGASTAPVLQLLSGPGLETYSTLSGPNITGLKTLMVTARSVRSQLPWVYFGDYSSMRLIVDICVPNTATTSGSLRPRLQSGRVFSGDAAESNCLRYVTAAGIQESEE